MISGKGHSYQIDLIEFWGRVLEWMGESEPVGVNFYVFTKAFDLVRVAKVRVKKGISGNCWLRSLSS